MKFYCGSVIFEVIIETYFIKLDLSILHIFILNKLRLKICYNNKLNYFNSNISKRKFDGL